MKILTQIQAAKAKSEESTWRRNSRPKRALHRDVFCPVSRIPSVESTKCGVDAFAKRTTRMKLNNCHLFNEIKSHPPCSGISPPFEKATEPLESLFKRWGYSSRGCACFML